MKAQPKASHFIGGSYVEDKNGKPLPVIYPATGEQIAKQADTGKYDLVMMGSHGHSALGNLVMGSVATQVLAHCGVPVMLVR